MKTFACLALAGVASAITMNDIKFMDFLAAHGKDYQSVEEFNFRAALFAKKDAILARINADPANTFTVGHNPMSDWTQEEQNRMYGHVDEHEHSPALNMADQAKSTGYVAVDTDDFVQSTTATYGYASSIDWKSKGCVTKVKYQGTCGSCWAFAAIAGIEGANCVRSGQNIILSEQQVLDCNPKGYGCGGGNTGTVFTWAIKQKIEKGSKYPYILPGKKGSCKQDNTGVNVSGKSNITRYSVSALKNAVTKGPAAVSVAASESVFNNYKTGVINNAGACGLNNNHAVTVIGYTSNYYIIKNSWDTWWGESGYAKIAINGDGNGVCGIQKDGTSPYIL